MAAEKSVNDWARRDAMPKRERVTLVESEHICSMPRAPRSREIVMIVDRHGLESRPKKKEKNAQG